jgi:16S rRNA (cytosine1402-N4)-methyltransferase
MKEDTVHTSVLLHEVVSLLDVEHDDVIVDCTLGGGGHAYVLAQKLSKDGMFIGIDLDPDALLRAQERLQDLPCTKIFVEDNYQNLSLILATHKIPFISKALIDLGLSSDQLDQSGRGFSFTKDEPLSMTFGRKATFDAQEIVNDWDEENLVTIFKQYGEEPFAKRIARAIVTSREQVAIVTTSDLVHIIEEALPRYIIKTARKHPATRVFQALRMTVNDEYQSLTLGLGAIMEHLESHGRVAVITFESVTDRTVKHTFRQWAQEGSATLLTKKPIIPSLEETERNPRARSAKLRGILKK